MITEAATEAAKHGILTMTLILLNKLERLPQDVIFKSRIALRKAHNIYDVITFLTERYFTGF